ncbi:hypothetical protein ACMD2_24665 [Ananas comosus]|uniref:FAR1 domain-containing protein n=1 Tax=Ananas comosus TaxID=4615 RepID=A0A199VCB5_ANACO|nr:hypothetical protein ACMD2_24665 [Ananas comosus]
MLTAKSRVSKAYPPFFAHFPLLPLPVFLFRRNQLRYSDSVLGRALKPLSPSPSLGSNIQIGEFSLFFDFYGTSFMIIILMELSRPINTSHEGEGASVIGSSNLEANNDEEDILGDETLLSVSIRGERENDSHENQRNQQQQLEEMSQEESAIDEPFFGQIFSNAEKAKDFYNIYAFKTGFSRRKQSHYKAKKLEGMVTTLVYTCSKEGQSKRQTNEMGNNVASSQTNRTPQKKFPFRHVGVKHT